MNNVRSERGEHKTIECMMKRGEEMKVKRMRGEKIEVSAGKV